MEIEIIHYGDKISNGYYNKLCEFKNLIYFKNGNDDLLIISNNKIPSFPNSIKINTLAVCGEIIEVNDKEFKIANRAYCKLDFIVYKSEIINSILNKRNLIRNIENLNLDISLIEKSPFSCLINNTLIKNSAFEKAFQEIIVQSWEFLKSNEIIAGIKLIKGAGKGLTPSGDDFISGLLIAINLIEILELLNLSSLKEKIYHESLTTNIFSKNFLHFAKNGYLYEYMQKLILSLNYNDQNLISNNLKLVTELGQSSGSDLLLGFYLGLKYKIGI